MKNNLKILFLFLFCVAIGYHIFLTLQKMKPCSEPIPYTLGAFSDRFDISSPDFLRAVAQAEALWETGLGRDLFVYDPKNTDNDVLKINLIYDYRQEATDKLDKLGGVVEDNQATYDSLQIQFKAKKSAYNIEESNLNTQIAVFNKKMADYENSVDYWNKKGGAPKPEYDALQSTRLTLDREMKSIEGEQVRLKKMLDEVNILVANLNRLAKTLNLTVDTYNNTNNARGESYEEGVYISDDSGEHIDIYEFSSREKLARVLAHELGHALGLDHVEDKKAIMYSFNEGNGMVLTQADLDVLKVVCNAK